MMTINIWFLDDVCRKAGGIRCNGRDKWSDILRMRNLYTMLDIQSKYIKGK